MSPSTTTATTTSNGQKPPNYGSFEATTKANNNYNNGTMKVSINSSGKRPLNELESTANNCQLEKEGEEEEKESLLLRLAKRIPCLGIMLALCASLFLGSAGMLVKMTRSVHGIQVAVLRAVIQLLIYGFVISVRKLPLWPDKSELKPVMGRALLGATSITFSYYALRLIPLGDATTIRFSLPIWTLIIGYFVLGEPCNLLRLLAVAISISGVVLIAKPDECVYLARTLWHSMMMAHSNDDNDDILTFGGLPTSNGTVLSTISLNNIEQPLSANNYSTEYRQFEGSLLALGSSICLSLSLVAMRLCRKTPAELVILWLSIIGIIVGSLTLLALDEWSMPNNWLDVLYILLNGLFGAIGQWFITNALKIEQSGIISLVRTFDIEVAFLYSAFLLHEHIRITSIVGSCLVTFGVLAVLVPKWLWPPPSSSSSSSSGRHSQLVENSNRMEGTITRGQSQRQQSTIQVLEDHQQKVAASKSQNPVPNSMDAEDRQRF